MCGIAGIASFDSSIIPKDSLIQAMVDTMHHRGPDGGGVDIREGVAMGMKRLAIIDLEGGTQPMFNAFRTTRLVFNGEIYNYRELRDQLISKGHTFQTQSDTEVILHAYDEYGVHFPKYLNGMFAIALHDLARHKLFLVRDPVGIKPLYYALDNRKLIWGSEIKSILASGLVEKELDLDALNAFLAWEYVPAPATLFRSIRKLEPGSLLEVDLFLKNTRHRQYWKLEPVQGKSFTSDAEWEERVDHQLRLSTQKQLVSDVPLGAFLSGGVDSSLIASAMGPVNTFSIGFEDPSYNELGWAKRVADHLKVPHVQEIVRPDIADLFTDLLYHLDDPIGDFSIFPTFLVSRLAREQITVALSGDGGDELFGGYESYVADSMAEQYGRIPLPLRQHGIEPLVASFNPRSIKKGLVNTSRRFLEGLSHDSRLRHARWRLFMGDPLADALYTPEVRARQSVHAASHILHLFEEASGFSPVNRNLYVDFKSYLSDNILTKVDRMSMAVSLEARVPFLDKDLVELAFQIPDHLKINRRKTKVLLKRLASRSIPRRCVYRPKQGFSIPIKNWLKTRLLPIMETYLDEQEIEAQGLFQRKTIHRLKAEHLANKANHSHILWSLIVFQAWRKRWLDAS